MIVRNSYVKRRTRGDSLNIYTYEKSFLKVVTSGKMIPFNANFLCGMTHIYNQRKAVCNEHDVYKLKILKTYNWELLEHYHYEHELTVIYDFSVVLHRLKWVCENINTHNLEIGAYQTSENRFNFTVSGDFIMEYLENRAFVGQYINSDGDLDYLHMNIPKLTL